MFFLPLILIAAMVLYVINVYNTLQTTKTRIQASIQEIGNQLKRQAELIPGLLESVKGYMKHEKDIFSMLTEARTSAQKALQSKGGKDIDTVNTQMQALLPKIQVLVESNPELKADTTVTQFMDEFRDTADKLMYSRRVLIDLSQDFNAKLVTFPSNIVANMFGFKSEAGLSTPVDGEFLHVTDADTKPINVKF